MAPILPRDSRDHSKMHGIKDQGYLSFKKDLFGLFRSILLIQFILLQTKIH